MSNYDYPEDEFDVGEDDGPVPVGVHRAQAPRWRSWVPLLAIIIIVPALAWGAVTLFLNGSGSGSSGAASSAQPAQSGQANNQASGGKSTEASKPADDKSADASASPSAGASASASGNVDFNTGVTVSNGTETSGLAKGASDKLTNGGFTAVEVTPGIYENAEPTKSTVYFSSPENRAAAEEVGKKLGITNVVESAENAQSNPIVVILRDDYKA
ncbi:LytR C-terminal domain-containing protein [Actinomyces sp. ZJ308]|uniref:LytR C-terminal domain-containing protein n=1 Tax=Actinomyces sp. ZJ308 TaxID=2708342 RepID=UPI001420D7AF|nr:LytR C-terminal domain-containing protein [Actinomyces sp. ZJ308]